MDALPKDLFALGLLVFVLGLKHGFDADHLAMIDSLTRFNARANPRMARFCGTLFSLGHGAVVIAATLVVSTFSRGWQTPEWLGLFGAWVSIGFLAALGLINIHAVLSAEPAQIVRTVGLKGRFLGGLTRAANPAAVALVGALFALSFDTMSQIALFALTAAHFGDWRDALMLGILFMLGMLVVDAVNGLWISRLIGRADQMALIASRAMSLVVGSVSLLVASFGLARLTLPSLAAWSDGKEVFFGGTVVAVIAGSFILAVWLTRATSAATFATGESTAAR